MVCSLAVLSTNSTVSEGPRYKQAANAPVSVLIVMKRLCFRMIWDFYIILHSATIHARGCTNPLDAYYSMDPMAIRR